MIGNINQIILLFCFKQLVVEIGLNRSVDFEFNLIFALIFVFSLVGLFNKKSQGSILQLIADKLPVMLIL